MHKVVKVGVDRLTETTVNAVSLINVDIALTTAEGGAGIKHHFNHDTCVVADLYNELCLLHTDKLRIIFDSGCTNHMLPTD